MRQMRPLGYSKQAVSLAAKTGRLHRVHRGVYAVGHARLTWEGRCMAAVLASEPAVASHATAGWLWGLLPTRPGTFHLTASTRRHPKAGAPYIVHFAHLLDQDIGRSEDIPVTSLARTLLDLAATLPTYRLERAIERAEERKLLDLGPIEELLARAGKHPGVTRLRRALDLYHPDPAVTRSEVERRFRALVGRAGLPAPAMNFNVAGFEVDAYWPSHRFAVEIDTYGTHGGRAAFERDRQRQEDLKLAGVEMTRVTDVRMKHDPRAWRRAWGRCSNSGAPSSTGAFALDVAIRRKLRTRCLN